MNDTRCVGPYGCGAGPITLNDDSSCPECGRRLIDPVECEEWFEWKREVPQMNSSGQVTDALLETELLDEVEDELNTFGESQSRDGTENLTELADRVFARYAERYPRREKGLKVEARVRTWIFAELRKRRIPNAPDEFFFDEVITEALGAAGIQYFEKAELYIGGVNVPVTNLSTFHQKGTKK